MYSDDPNILTKENNEHNSINKDELDNFNVFDTLESSKKLNQTGLDEIKFEFENNQDEEMKNSILEG